MPFLTHTNIFIRFFSPKKNLQFEDMNSEKPFFQTSKPKWDPQTKAIDLPIDSKLLAVQSITIFINTESEEKTILDFFRIFGISMQNPNINLDINLLKKIPRKSQKPKLKSFTRANSALEGKEEKKPDSKSENLEIDFEKVKDRWRKERGVCNVEKMCEDYVAALEWTFYYYYNGCIGI